MIANISTKIASWCCPKADDAEYEAVCYGIGLLLETLYKNGLSLLLGLITGYFAETLIILIMFKLLRVQAGGGHASSGLCCTIYTVSVVFIGAVFNKYLMFDRWLLWCIYGFSLAVLWCFAPSATLNNPINDQALRRRKKTAALLLVSIGFILVYSGILGNYGGLVTYSIVIEIISVIINEIKKRRILK